MSTRYEKAASSQEAMAALLATIPGADAPWNKEFQKQFCRECGLQNCDECPHEEYRNNPGWWLGLDVGPKMLTRWGEKSGWFSPEKKTALVDKLAPIEHEAGGLLGQVCDGYCRFTCAASGKTQEEMEDICADCPLAALARMIGVER